MESRCRDLDCVIERSRRCRHHRSALAEAACGTRPHMRRGPRTPRPLRCTDGRDRCRFVRPPPRSRPACCCGSVRALLRQVLAQPRPLPQLDDLRVGRLQPPETVRVGPQRRGQHPRVPTVVLRARRRDTVPGLIEWTTKPRFIRLSTTGPRGTSIATPTAAASPPAIDNSQSAISESPWPPCSNARSATTSPAASVTHAWYVCEPQSTPTNHPSCNPHLLVCR